MLTKLLNDIGFATATGVLTEAEVVRYAEAADAAFAASGGLAGVRGLFKAAPAFAALERHAGVRALVEPVLGPGAFVARAILFDKRPDANWDVPWHQDKTIAVRERLEAPGFGPWSVKHGVHHVQPPAEVLARMLTVRLHLDDCGPENGALLAIPGSHMSMMTEEEVSAEAWDRHPAKAELVVRRGDAVLMRPLILHASKKSREPSRRRVVHLEFAFEQLPCGLRWNDA
ncbi:MAG TPA: phytanoyl-CoA dioxygenase family protein [Phycisphaerales bacterium]|nr:phytanoyl-CoA dioxygenase family protein [Phycisphaerales bacterium]